MGFPTSVRQWLAGELYEPIRELLESREARERGVYNTGAVMQDLEKRTAEGGPTSRTGCSGWPNSSSGLA